MAQKSKKRAHMEHRPLISWDEEDAFTSWKRMYTYLKKPGAKAFIKNKANRRARRAARHDLRGSGARGSAADF